MNNISDGDHLLASRRFPGSLPPSSCYQPLVIDRMTAARALLSPQGFAVFALSEDSILELCVAVVVLNGPESTLLSSSVYGDSASCSEGVEFPSRIKRDLGEGLKCIQGSQGPRLEAMLYQLTFILQYVC